MSKSILHRLFGLGRIPRRYDQTLRREGIVLLDEGIGGSVTLRHFKAPGRRHSWKRSWFTGCLVLTESTFAAFTLFRPIIYVPLADTAHLAALECTIDRDGVLVIAYDASVFNDDWSGHVECRFKTSLGKQYIDRLARATSGAKKTGA